VTLVSERFAQFQPHLAPQQTLWEDDYGLFLMRLPALVGELECLIRAEPEALELVSSRIVIVISDLSIPSLCMGQLKLCQP
jgi:hypothetical protein